MRTHTLIIRCREIHSTSPRVVANQLNADYVELSMDSEWDGMSVAVIFGCGESAVKLLWEGEPLPIPSELTKEPGYLPVTVAGYLDDVRVVSAEARDALAIVPSGCYDGSDPIPEEPDMLGQLTQAAKDATDAAEAANEAAANANATVIKSAVATTLNPGEPATANIADNVLTIGVPKGEKGDKGDKGDPGQDGQNGTDGTDGVTPFTQATVTTLEPDSPATVTIEEDTLKLGIPKGAKGDKGDTGDQGPQGEPGQDGQDATLPEGMVTTDGSGALSSLGSDGEPSIMTNVVVGNIANSNVAMMRTSGNSPSISLTNSQTKAQVGFGLVDGEPVLGAGKSQSDQKFYGFSPTIPEDDTLTVVTSDAYKADVEPLKQRIAELENQAANVVTGTATGYVAHAEDAYSAKPREVTVKGRTVNNLWPVITGERKGVTLACDETGLFTLSGTPTANAYINSDNIKTFVAGRSYSFSVSNDIGFTTSSRPYIEFYDADSIILDSFSIAGQGATTPIVAPHGTSFAICLVAVYKNEPIEGSFRVMLVEGTEAPDCFTPTGIHSVQPKKLVTAGKNLMPKFTPVVLSSAGMTGTINDDNSITLNGTATGRATFALFGASPFTDVLGKFAPGIYTLSVGSKAAGISFDIIDWRKQQSIFAVNTNLSSSHTKTLSYTTEYTYIRIQVAAGTTLNNVTIYPQIELGSTATAYEPPDVTTTPLPEVELRSLPNGTCDELVIGADGTCRVERKTGTFTFNGSENWATEISIGETGVPYFSYRFAGTNENTPLRNWGGYNDRLLTENPYTYSGDCFYIFANGGGYTARIRKSGCDDVTSIKEWLASNNVHAIYGTVNSTEPQSPVTLPVLPAPTFNQYHDGDVPSDTSTEYVRDINLVLANLESVQTALLGGE